MPFTWYPFGLPMDIDAVIIDELMHGDAAQMRNFGHDLGVRS